MTELPRILQRAAESQGPDPARDPWRGSANEAIKRTELDTRGAIGEVFIQAVLEAAGHTVERDATTDPVGKHWDLLVDGKVKLEVKTATVGKDGKKFQHENIEKDKNWDGLVLLDVAPNVIYTTFAAKQTLPFVESSRHKGTWTVNERSMHRRRTSNFYKWDLSVKDLKDRAVTTVEDVVQHYNARLDWLEHA